jgi:DNA mismatch repair protein MutS
MDEIGRGTSTFDGLALASGIAATCTTRQAFTLFATHYFELTEFPATHHGAVNVHVSAAESGARHRVPARAAARPGQPQLRHGRWRAGRRAGGRAQPCPPRAGRAGNSASASRAQVDLFAPPPAAKKPPPPSPL